MFHGHLDYFEKPPFESRLDTKPRDHGTLNAHKCWFILFYHVWEPAWLKIHWNSIWLRAGHIWLHIVWCWRFLGTAFGHFLLGSHNFMVTALGSCMKWPLDSIHSELWTFILREWVRDHNCFDCWPMMVSIGAKACGLVGLMIFLWCT